MIHHNETACCDSANESSHQQDSRACSAPDSVLLNQKTWNVNKTIQALIEVSATDASTLEEAQEFADSLIAALPLKVSIGGVPLEASFVVS